MSNLKQYKLDLFNLSEMVGINIFQHYPPYDLNWSLFCFIEIVMSSIILEGLSISEFENLLKRVLIAERITEVAQQSKQVPAQNENNYLTRREAAKRLNISLPTLAKYSLDGLIPFYRIGARVLYKWNEIDEALQKVTTNKYKVRK
jgi:excisionase family DNA binding protein